MKYKPLTRIALSLTQGLLILVLTMGAHLCVSRVSAEEPLQIDKAYFGAAGSWRDITALLTYNLKRNALSVSISQPFEEIGGDPAPGVGKHLLIDYHFKGQPYRLLLQEEYPVAFQIRLPSAEAAPPGNDAEAAALLERIAAGPVPVVAKAGKKLAQAAAVEVPRQSSDVDLKIGDLAPKLKVGKWVQGDPVRDFDSKHVYILEFWATWCGPCRASIPHLNELAEKFKAKDVIVIGQDVWDQDSAVAPFVKQMGERMTYRVALDDKSTDRDGFMTAHWWPRGVGHHGIPVAFVINKDRRIAWIGHPMGLNEALLNQIVSGSYDLSKAAAEFEEQKQKDEKWNAVVSKFSRALKEHQWDAAASALNEVVSLLPEPRRSAFAPNARLQILLGQKKYQQAYQFVDSFEDNAQDNEFAWTILTQKGVEQRNVNLALKLAERANQASGGTNAAVLDTLARAQFMCGKTNEAIASEEQALKCKQRGDSANYQKILTSYREGKLPEVEE